MRQKPQSPNRTVKLHIDELALHGFPPQDRQRIAQAVQTELVRLIGERGLPASLTRTAAIPNVDGGSFRMAPEGDAENAGAGIARSLYTSLNGK
jgi:hypothetical protein